MKRKFFKKFVPLMLVLVLCLINVSTAFAYVPTPDPSSPGVSSTLGGTWKITRYNPFPNAENNPWGETAYNIVYLPADKVRALNDALIIPDVVAEFANRGYVAVSAVFANEIAKKYSINITPLVGMAWTCIEIANFMSDYWYRVDFVNAKNSSSSGAIKYVESLEYGQLSGDFSPWDGYFMPTNIPFENNYYGYCVGSIQVGYYDFFGDFN